MHPTLIKIRPGFSRWSFVVGVALLVCCAVLLITIWRTAAADGMIPQHWADYQGSNHGPWRYYYVGRELVWQAMTMPFLAGVAALLSVLIKPNLRAGVLLGICAVVFIVVTEVHFWLVD
jgi:hypothetical protein